MSDVRVVKKSGEQVSFHAEFVGRDKLVSEYTALTSVLEVVQSNRQVLLTKPAQTFLAALVAERLTQLSGLLAGGPDD